MIQSTFTLKLNALPAVYPHSLPFFEFPIMHALFCLFAPKFCVLSYCFQMILGICRIWKCKIWGDNKVNYGELENREIRLDTRMIVVSFSSLKSTAIIVYYFIRGDISVVWVNTLIFAANKTEHNKISTKYSQICVKRLHWAKVKKQEFTGTLKYSKYYKHVQVRPITMTPSITGNINLEGLPTYPSPKPT